LEEEVKKEMAREMEGAVVEAEGRKGREGVGISIASARACVRVYRM